MSPSSSSLRARRSVTTSAAAVSATSEASSSSSDSRDDAAGAIVDQHVDEAEPPPPAHESSLQRPPSFSQRAISQTLSGTANLANLLPTGTLLAFQLLTPIFTNNGTCDSATKPLTIILLALLASSCFLASFTDSVKASDGQVYYGFATFKGMYLFLLDTNAEEMNLRKYRLRFIDWVHAILTVLVLGAVALRDRNVVSCFYPQPAHEVQEVLDIVPIGIGLLSSLLFVVFPTRRHGIGYPVKSTTVLFFSSFRSKPVRINRSQPSKNFNLFTPTIGTRTRTAVIIRSVSEHAQGFDHVPTATELEEEEEEASATVPVSTGTGLEKLLSTAASLYPLYVTAGAVVACLKPSAFSWFVQRGPASYSLSLGMIMLSMGLTLDLNDLFSLFMQRPLSILFGCAAQYTIMPAFGMILSKLLGLSPSLSVGLILLACCPGGTASNVVTLIAKGDVALSVVMTVCTTLGAVILTPLLTKILAGTYVPVDSVNISISTLQVVVAPILLGCYLQRKFPRVVKVVNRFAPLFAVLACSLVAGSVFSENVVRVKSSLVGASSATSNLSQSPMLGLKSLVSGEMGIVIVSVLLLHFAGFFVGYISSAICGFKEAQRRAISIEVGMQNSSLGVVLASCHFTSSPLVALPAAMSAVVMNIMGSTLGFFWRYVC